MAACRDAFSSSSSLVPEAGSRVGAMRVGFLAVRWRLAAPVGLPLDFTAAGGEAQYQWQPVQDHIYS